MKSKSLLKLLGAICLAVLITIPLAVSCAAPEPTPAPAPAPGPAPAPTPAPAPAPTPTPPPGVEVQKWKLQHTNTPGGDPQMFTHFAELREDVLVGTNGTLDIEAYGVGEIVGLTEMLEACGSDIIQMYHDFINQWVGRNTAFELFAAHAFGPSNYEFYLWYTAGPGEDYANQLYADYNIKPFPMHRTFIRVGGMSKFPINSLEDMQGKRFRTGAGMAQDVLKAVGIDAFWCAGTECYGALDRGVADILEWGDPPECWAMKFHEVAGYMLYPAWTKTGETRLNCINLDRWNSLTDQQRKVLELALRKMCWKHYAISGYESGVYFQKLLDYGTVPTKLDTASLQKIKNAADVVYNEWADANPLFKEIWESQKEFVRGYQKLADFAKMPVLE